MIASTTICLLSSFVSSAGLIRDQYFPPGASLDKDFQDCYHKYSKIHNIILQTASRYFLNTQPLPGKAINKILGVRFGGVTDGIYDIKRTIDEVNATAGQMQLSGGLILTHTPFIFEKSLNAMVYVQVAFVKRSDGWYNGYKTSGLYDLSLEMDTPSLQKSNRTLKCIYHVVTNLSAPTAISEFAAR
ncbi:hypothetical protein [Deinococcus sp.]|uniref:hypothetical protein n=1 Tax=Deinococcus sp. TaxID=47478 RepID=UPI003C7A7150